MNLQRRDCSIHLASAEHLLSMHHSTSHLSIHPPPPPPLLYLLLDGDLIQKKEDPLTLTHPPPPPSHSLLSYLLLLSLVSSSYSPPYSSVASIHTPSIPPLNNPSSHNLLVQRISLLNSLSTSLLQKLLPQNNRILWSVNLLYWTHRQLTLPLHSSMHHPSQMTFSTLWLNDLWKGYCNQIM